MQGVIRSAFPAPKQIESAPVIAVGGISLEQAVRQRIVGAAMLTAIAVIALPLMFDMERPAPIRVTEEMPPRPEMPLIPRTMPKAPEPLQPAPVPVADMYAMNGEAVPVPSSPLDSESVPASTSTMTGSATQDVHQMDSVSPPAADTTISAQPKTPVQAKAVTQPKPAASLPVIPPAPGGKLDEKGVPEAWAVQVAAMSDRTKADTMIRELKAKGFTAFAVAGSSSKGNTVRVFIGPKLDKAAAIKIKHSVDKSMGLQTMVVPFSARQ